MSKTYYTLVCRESKNHDWAPQFGDYDLEVVKDEQQDYRESGAWAFTKIIRSKDDQASIDAAVDKLNRGE